MDYAAGNLFLPHRVEVEVQGFHGVHDGRVEEIGAFEHGDHHQRAAGCRLCPFHGGLVPALHDDCLAFCFLDEVREACVRKACREEERRQPQTLSRQESDDILQITDAEEADRLGRVVRVLSQRSLGQRADIEACCKFDHAGKFLSGIVLELFVAPGRIGDHWHFLGTTIVIQL